MLLQALLTVALLAVLAGALLTNSLLQANVAAHQMAVRLTTTALARGTSDFVTWAQTYVAQHGAATAWPPTTVTEPAQPACAAAATTCTTFATIAYAVAGSSATATSGPDPAENLQSALHENRISGTVTATITNQNGTVLATRTRLLTVRVFDAAPYAVVTGAREASAMAGSVSAAEGDEGGYRDTTLFSGRATPDPSKPMTVKDTTVRVTMTCANSASNSNETEPMLDNNQPGNDDKPWGVSGGQAFEAPCSPSYLFSSTPPIPADAFVSENNVYDVSAFNSASWSALLPNPTFPR
jgi:hypothetical protein